MNVPDGLHYAESHEWLKVEGDMGTIGITDHAQNELSDIVYVELPKVGNEYKKGAVLAVVESVKAASDIYAPISGEVTEINTSLEADPALVNSDPYGDAWMLKMKLSNPNEVSALQDATAYKAQIG